jgi:hypothetical protein
MIRMREIKGRRYYRLYGTATHKSSAEARAERVRVRGHTARVIKEQIDRKIHWAVWTQTATLIHDLDA